ncbi:unnamed protein product [Rangifer tarandus platyrhynchus]|uniref:Uncharacterized protein n=2 Tax=Rangifer tarandus platyrhynchus TaxID=3082113 RepID=A0ABN8ZH07_RANTA|nr:unnamed protein product [Rangifer tarandus platyrhynchus]CAI9706013.1 unnamed protein product [Rangifer tarandus platyrhynchus]
MLLPAWCSSRRRGGGTLLVHSASTGGTSSAGPPPRTPPPAVHPPSLSSSLPPGLKTERHQHVPSGALALSGRKPGSRRKGRACVSQAPVMRCPQARRPPPVRGGGFTADPARLFQRQKESNTVTTTTSAGRTSATSGDAYPSRGARLGIRRHVPDTRVVAVRALRRREGEAPEARPAGADLSRVHAVRRKPGAAVDEKRAPL